MGLEDPPEVKHLDLETLEAAEMFALHLVRRHLRLRIYELKEEQHLQRGSGNSQGSGFQIKHCDSCMQQPVTLTWNF